MGLDAVLAKAIGIADKITKPVQSTIQWYAWLSQDIRGKATYETTPTPLKGVVDLRRKLRHQGDGKLITVVASITIMQVVPPNGAADRHEPIDPRDKLILPDGTTGPILGVPGAVWYDAAGRPFLNEIYLGEPETL